jgi:hypothetical protein
MRELYMAHFDAEVAAFDAAFSGTFSDAHIDAIMAPYHPTLAVHEQSGVRIEGAERVRGFYAMSIGAALLREEKYITRWSFGEDFCMIDCGAFITVGDTFYGSPVERPGRYDVKGATLASFRDGYMYEEITFPNVVAFAAEAGFSLDPMISMLRQAAG